MPELSIIVPTYEENQNIPLLAERIHAALKGRIDYEVLVVDDSSPDGTADAVRALDTKYKFAVLVRTTTRGLARAVVAGIKATRSPLILVMDADLSHSPENILAMYDKLHAADIVVGSRYVQGGRTYKWTLFRRINSFVATLLARPLTRIKDPMAGFFLFPRDLLAKVVRLDPIGYKILLEIIVKTRAKRVVEVPINFVDRVYGRSKLSLKEQFLYCVHILRLYTFKLRYLFRSK